MYSIDIIISKKERWQFKDLLFEKQIKYAEWFMEFDIESSIISIEIESGNPLEELMLFLEERAPASRLILPNGSNFRMTTSGINKIKQYFINLYNKDEE